MSKKVYIDCQSFQTEAWDRGMGRYTMSLLESLYKIENDFDFNLIFSVNLPDNQLAIQALKGTLPTAKIAKLDLKSTLNDDYNKAAKHNKNILNSFLAKDDSPQDAFFLIPSLFQEPAASVFPDNVRKSLIYYDAIPFLYYGRYKEAIDHDAYMQRHAALYEADVIFTISQTIADDLMIYFGISNTESRQVINIDGACNEDMFLDIQKPKYAPKEKYILLPSSSDIRKNNYNAVRAFEQLRALTSVDYKLVITSTFSKSQRDDLKRISPNILFTGNVSQSELAWLYNNAQVVFFASEYEGLGLPVLESIRSNKPVACSNIAVFREISEDAFYFFDPMDISEMTLKLYQAIEGDNWRHKHRLYASIDQKYQWQRSAKLVAQSISFSSDTEPKKQKMKIAILGPVPNGYSAIGKVIQELHDVTSRNFEVDYYLEDHKGDAIIDVRPNILKYIAKCYSIADFNAKVYGTYDAVVYHIGNSEYHFYTILNALYLPGLVIFHDTSLREAYGEMVRLGFVSEQRLIAEGQLDDLMKSKNSAFIGSLSNNIMAGIAHSKYAQKAIKAGLLDKAVRVAKAELPAVVPARDVHSQRRDKIHVGLGGVLTGNKGLDIIKNIALDTSISEDIVLHVFGFNFVEPEIVEELSMYKNVKLMTDLSDLEYQTQLANLDILVNFRINYRGETSLTVIEAMRYGCIAIVNGALGWFSELPDDAVYKIEKQDDVIPAIRALVRSPGKRKAVADAARSYIYAHHSPSHYLNLLTKTLGEMNDTQASIRRNAIIQGKTLDETVRIIEP